MWRHGRSVPCAGRAARDATVAIKSSARSIFLLGSPCGGRRFEREAKTISSLNHPHICVLYDVGSQDGVDYLVMECVEGEIRWRSGWRREPLPHGASAEVSARRSLEALEKAHRAWRGAPGLEAGRHHADVERREIAGFWISEAGAGFGQPGDADGGDAEVSRTLR